MRITPSVPRFSDARVTIRWALAVVLPLIVAIVFVAFLVPRPEPALAVGLLGAAALVAATIFGILGVRIPRVPFPK
jgi:hypothetical protein